MKREKNISSLILEAESGRGVGGWGGLKSNSRERKSNFSLDFQVFGPSDFVEPRSKVVLRCKGYAWAPVLESFDKLRKVGVFSYLI